MAGVSQASVMVGRRFRCKVGSRIAEVEVVGVQTSPRWRCHVRTMDTNRTILVRGVQRLRPLVSPRDRILAAKQAREAEVANAQAAAARSDEAAAVRSKLAEDAEVQAGLRRFGRLLGGFLG